MQVSVPRRPGIPRLLRKKPVQLVTLSHEVAAHIYERVYEYGTTAHANARRLIGTVLPRPVCAAIASRTMRPTNISASRVDTRTAQRLGPPLRLRLRLTQERAVVLCATVLSIGAYVWYTAHGQTLAYFDSIAHLMIARRVVASQTPGLAQFGTVWLPFQHILMIPFVWNDTLFRSGLAGSLPSMAGYVVSVLYAYRSGKLLFGTAASGWLAAAVCGLNPNLLYIQATPMTEAVMLGASLVGIYYLVRWVAADAPADLVKSAMGFLAALLTRYDGWFLAGIAVIVVMCVAWRRHGKAGLEALALLFGGPLAAGAFGWLLYNIVIFHDPLAFFRNSYSSMSQQTELQHSIGLPTIGNMPLSVHVYSAVVVDCLGGVIVVLALLGVVIWATGGRGRLLLPALVTLAPLAFNVASLIGGASSIFTPEVPLGGVAMYYNDRYGIMMLPAAALAIAAFGKLRLPAIPAATCLAMLIAIGIVSMGGTPYLLQEPLHSSTLDQAAGQWLNAHYQGGYVLASYKPDVDMLFFSHVPTQDIITEADATSFAQVLASPQSTAEWIIIDTSTSADPVTEELADRSDWQRFYVLRLVIGTTYLYQRIGGK